MGGQTSEEREAGAERSAPSAAAPLGRVSEAAAAPLIGLQQAAGNRAVGRLLVARRRQARSLQRCAGPGCSCGCLDEDEDELAHRLQRRVLARDLLPGIIVGEGIDIIANMPSYQPNPPWSSPGSDNPAPTCTPFGSAEAKAKWAMMWQGVPAAITSRCGCAAVGGAYRMYLLAKGGTVEAKSATDCINVQLASEDAAHKKPEEDAINAALSKVPGIAKANLPAPGATTSLPLVATLGLASAYAAPSVPPPAGQRYVRLTYRRNTLAGGLLFGGDSDDGSTSDSEYGPDLRLQGGNLVLKRLDDGSNPAAARVAASIDFHYDVNDALDFCPGNTLQKSSGDTIGDFEYNFVIGTLSRLEASGMARDVKLLAHYDRHKDLGSFDAT